MIGYRLKRSDCNGWLFAGTTPTEVADTIKSEIENNIGLTTEECGQIIIEACEFTQKEIDNMPEFPGW